MASAVTENDSANVEVSHPSVEICQFTTAASGDYYDVRKLREVNAAFACQETTDGVELQVSWEIQSNGRYRVSITPETGTVYTGYLIIYGSI